MADFAQIAITMKNWVAYQWNVFETPPSAIERNATQNFIDAGIYSNRFLGTYKAIGAIAASSIMVLGNPVEGIFKGAVSVIQGNISHGLTVAARGVFNSTRSFYNINLVFSTAVFGLFARQMMYGNMPRSLTKRDLVALEDEFTEQLGEVENLREEKRALQSTSVDIVNNVVTHLNSLDMVNTTVRNVNYLLSQHASPLTQLKQHLEEANTKVNSLLQEIANAKDPKNSKEYKELEADTRQKVEDLNRELERIKLQIQTTENGQKLLTDEHAAKLELLTKEHEKAVEDLKQKFNESQLAKEALEKSKTELCKNHEIELNALQSTFDKSVDDCKKLQEENIKQLTDQLAVLKKNLEKAESDHSTALQQLNTQITTLTQEHNEAVKEIEELRKAGDAKNSTKIEELNQQLIRANQEMETTKNDKDLLISQHNTKLEDLRQKHEKIIETLKNSHEDTIAQKTNELKTNFEQESKKLKEDHSTALEPLIKQIASLTTERDEARKKIEELQQAAINGSEKDIAVATLQEKIEGLEQVLNVKDKRKQELENALDELEKREIKLKTAYQSELQKLSQTPTSLPIKTVEMLNKSLTELTEDYKNSLSTVQGAEKVFNFIVNAKALFQMATTKDMTKLSELKLNSLATRALEFQASISRLQITNDGLKKSKEATQKELEAKNKRLEDLEARLKEKTEAYETEKSKARALEDQLVTITVNTSASDTNTNSTNQGQANKQSTNTQ